MNNLILTLLMLLALSGCATSPDSDPEKPAKYSASNCWGEDDPLRCRAPVPEGCEEIAPNIFWCGKRPLSHLGK